MQTPIAFTLINQVKIAERVDGPENAAHAVVLLHGWGAEIKLVWPLAERLVAQGHRCFALDLPGFGQSDLPPQPWSVQDYADLVIAYLDAHGLERPHIFGHSFGGRLGLVLGAHHPQRVQKLMLANSAGIRAQQSRPVQLRQGAYRVLRNALTRMGARSLADALRERYNARFGSPDFQQTSGVMRETFVKVVSEDLRNVAARVQAPTLLLWGDQDDATPLWQGKILEETIPDAGLVVHEGAGHYSYLDRLAETARIMDYFMKTD